MDPWMRLNVTYTDGRTLRCKLHVGCLLVPIVLAAAALWWWL